MAKSVKKSTKKKAGKRKAASKANRTPAKSKTAKRKTRATSKKRAQQAATTACVRPYCELYCSNGTWFLTGEAHDPGYYCPVSLPGGDCTSGSKWCSTPQPGQVEPEYGKPENEEPKHLRLNTGIYKPDDGVLYLERGRYDLKHYCPNKLKLKELAGRQPELYVALLLALKNKNIEVKSVTIKAWRKP